MGALALILILEHVYDYSRYLQVIITQNSKPNTYHCISTRIFHREVLHLISGSVHDQTRNETELRILWLQVTPQCKLTVVVFVTDLATSNTKRKLLLLLLLKDSRVFCLLV